MSGKLKREHKLSLWVEAFFVPKSWFVHFYLISWVLCFILLVQYPPQYFSCSALCRVLFLFHSFRRLLECHFITDYGNSKIHVVYYIGGLVHYLAANFTILGCGLYEEQRIDIAVPLQFSLTNIVIVLWFVLANILQCHSHYILYRLKKSTEKKADFNESNKRYLLPSGGAFELCTCPHFLSEVNIYLSLAILCSFSLPVWLMFFWVLINQSVSAMKHYSYYYEQFPEEMERKKLAILFPFIW